MSADLKTLLRRGLSAHEGNRPDEAEKIYRRALSLSPGNPEVEHLLATLLTSLDRHREAGDSGGQNTKHPDRGVERIDQA